ncbi:MAG TPA: hypothetical protein PK198_22085, partial [Saprospiraceae bacterium]|nr:hypothetical protein [Saprospiraceae bacterium]
MYRLSLLFALLSFSLLLPAQDEGLAYEDRIYKSNIRSVLFHVNGLVLTQPIIDLSTGVALQLTFDDMDADT